MEWTIDDVESAENVNRCACGVELEESWVSFRFLDLPSTPACSCEESKFAGRFEEGSQEARYWGSRARDALRLAERLALPARLSDPNVFQVLPERLRVVVFDADAFRARYAEEAWLPHLLVFQCAATFSRLHRVLPRFEGELGAIRALHLGSTRGDLRGGRDRHLVAQDAEGRLFRLELGRFGTHAQAVAALRHLAEGVLREMWHPTPS